MYCRKIIEIASLIFDKKHNECWRLIAISNNNAMAASQSKKFQSISISIFTITYRVREAAKINGLFLVARPLRPYTPPLEFSGHKKISRIFLRASKTVFFLSGQAPLNGRATKKDRYFLRLLLPKLVYKTHLQ